jgi:hypothetical protein
MNKMETVTYENTSVPVIGTFDTVIVGGGTAGASAGITAAREGNHTLLIEKSISLGGSAAGALVTPMMESFVTHENNFYEIEKRLRARGVMTRDGIMNYVYSTPESKAAVLEEMFLENHGEILYDASLAGCTVKNRKIDTVFVTTVDGMSAVRGKQFIDATGDALLSRMAGVTVASGDENQNNQMSSLRFEMGGIDTEKYRNYCLSLNDNFSPLKTGFFWESAMVKNRDFKLEPVFRTGIEKGYLCDEDLIYYQCFSLPGEPGCMTFNCPHIGSMKKNTSAAARSYAVHEGRQKIDRLVAFLQHCMPGFENSYIIRIASALGIRESWRICGKYILNEDDYIHRAKFDDAVAKGDWYIDVHSANKGLIHMEKYNKGEFYEIPYRCLINNTIENMLTIGRCISTTFLVQASIRIQPTVIDMGDSAGKACAKALNLHCELADFDGKGLLQ